MTKEEFSAGGIVFKEEHGQLFILLSQHSGHHGWVFPKGFIGDKIEGESKEDTALREVTEETGAIGEIIEPVSPISYWYQMNREKHHKTVYYFLMKFVGGDITKHDWEMENVEWLEDKDVALRLTYPSDKTVWQKAHKRLQEITK
ncbi:MAG TPA: NUDIX domain-containing protein [Patescibacteria group bacterium]|nr:NUDIX domain-containing protein [Patescibacteria group bacterium]